MSRSLAKSTTVVGGMTLTSRVMGFLRDIVFARFFGAGVGMDVFVVAFQIPNFLRRLFGEGAFSQAFVPVLSEYQDQRAHQEVQALADRVAGTLGLILMIITVIGIVASPVLILLFAPGFSGEEDKFALAAGMLRLTFPYLLFISLVAFAGGILNTFGRFAVPAFTPVLLNVVLIASVFLLAPRMEQPVYGLAIGVFIAGLVQLAFQIPFLKRVDVLPRPRWGWRHEGVRRIIRLMMPAIFGSSVAQINLLVDRVIASFLATGSISWLYYSDRLLEFPLGVFAIALATVILPGLSRHHAGKSPQAFSATLDWALKLAMVIALPAAVGMFFLAAPMVATLFNYGAFGAEDVRMAAFSVMAYSLGLMAFTLVKVLSPAYFSRQDTRTPVRISVIALLTNILLNIVIVLPMMHFGIAAPHAGLALATGLAAVLNASLLYRGLLRQGVYRPTDGWAWLALRVAAANIVMAVLLWRLAGDLDRWLMAPWFERAYWLAGCIITGVFTYLAVLWLGGVRPRHLMIRHPVAGK
ncbi:MAG: murein biosynthesis integral membrane protein MurJ [Gammaproteobacteria bacterium]|nr:MAG: murein biosynthesis integral membrane protein MurJ [Gammaproteobacteria bacterium]